MHRHFHRHLRFVLVAAVVALISTASLWAQKTVTWDNSGGTMRWNTTEDNWVGDNLFVAGDTVTFGTTGAGAVYIGTAGPTPVNVSPAGTMTVNGNYTFTGGGLQGSASLFSGWDRSVYFDGYTSDVHTFSGGVSNIQGWLYFRPSGNDGSYSFGTGTIDLGSRGGGYTFHFHPQGNNNTLTNDFYARPGLTSTWNAANTGGFTGNKILGNVTLDGNLSVISEFAANAILTGNRTISLSGRITGAITGASYQPTIFANGNNEAWTDALHRVQDSGSTPTWTIAGLVKDGPGNLIFDNPRDLGETITLRAGALVIGGQASTTNLIRDTASVNMTGGKLFLRRNGTGSDTETIGSLNLQAAHNEIFLSTNAGAVNTLASTTALTRSNHATALVSSNNLGGSSNAGHITFPEAPTMIGGGGAAGTTTISIIPFLIGGTSAPDYSSGAINADKGSTLVTYDAGTGSLRTLNTLTEFATNIDGVSGTTTNVRRTSAETLTAARTVNALVLDGGNALTLNLGGNTLTVNSGALLARATTGQTITLGNAVGDGYLDFAGGEGVVSVTASDTNYQNGTLRINSVIQNGGLTKAGYGILDLRADNTFTGPFVVNSGSGGNGNNYTGVNLHGTLATTDIRLMGGWTTLFGDDRFNTDATPMIDNRVGAQLRLGGFNQTFKSLQNGPNGGGTVTGAGILTLNPDAGDTAVFTGSMAGLGRLVKAGPNVLTLGLSGGPSHLYLEEGILRRTTAFGAGQWHFRGGILEGPHNFRDLTYNSNVFFGPGGGGWSAQGGNMTIWISGGTAQEWGVSPGFIQTGDPLLFNTIYSDSWVRYDSPINLGSSGTNDREIRVTDNPGSATDYAIINGVISGSGSGNVLWKTGDGLLELAVNNSYTGGTKISDGTLRIAADGNLGAVPGAPTVNVTLDGGVLQYTNTGTITQHASRQILITPGNMGVLDLQGGEVIVAGRITGDGALEKRGPGTLRLSNAGNDYTGGTTIAAGQLRLDAANALGAGGSLDIAGGATLNMNGHNATVGAFSGLPGATVTNNAAGTGTATLTVDFAAGASTYAGTIADGTTAKIALHKDGAGTLILAGTHTHTGGTTLAAGTLRVDTSLGGNIVMTGGILAGNGTIATSLTVPSGAGVAPGTSPGHLTVTGDYQQQAGATLYIELAGDEQGVTYDWLSVGGEALLDGFLSVDILDGYKPAYGQTFTVLTADSVTDLGLALSGAYSGMFLLDVGPDYVLLTSLIPEPTSGLLLALAGLALLRRRRV